jgi:hypothetical protein
MTSFAIIPHQFTNCTISFHIAGKAPLLKPFFKFSENNPDNVS